MPKPGWVHPRRGEAYASGPISPMRCKTDKQVRAAFWRECFGGRKPSGFIGKPQNQLPCEIRTAFVDFVDALQKDGRISEALAGRVTL